MNNTQNPTYKFLTLVLFILLAASPYAHAKIIQRTVSYADFDKAAAAKDLTWIVESTKVGLFASDVYGYVLNYSYSADFDEENKILRNMTLTFPIEAMNSDSESRDGKLHTLCMGMPEFKEVKVTIAGPIFLKDHKERTYQGNVSIRGKEKPFSINFLPSLENDNFRLVGKSVWSLKALEIPDPSIAVAKLSDEIRLNITLSHPLN